MKYEKIVERAVEIFGYKTDKELAQQLDISQQSFSNRKYKGTLLKELIEAISELHPEVNLDWLLHGRGPKYVPNDIDQIVPSERKDEFREIDPEADKLLEMAQQVIQSDSTYREPLKTNIRSYHQAMADEKKYNALGKELEEVGCKRLVSIDGARIRHDDPPQEKDEILKRRAI